MKPGDLVTLKMSAGAHEGECYDLLSRNLDTFNGRVFGVEDVGLVLEMRVYVHTFYRVLTSRGDGWIVQGRVKKVTCETGC